MNKKKLDISHITNELEGGASMFFPQTPSSQEIEQSSPPSSNEKEGTEVVTPKDSTKSLKTTPKEDKEFISITSNITILQSDIKSLRSPSYKPQTFRLGDEEIERLKELAYTLSRLLKKKVTQGDLLRVAILLFEKNMKTNKEEILEILREL